MEIKLIKDLRIKIGARLLDSKARQIQRYVKAVSLKNAKTVGIIFEAGSQANLKLIKDLVNGFKLNGTKVEVIGYLPGKKKNYQYIGDKTYSFISDEDFNFFMKPVSEIINGFISWKPEILLILSPNYYFPLHYIAKLSKAGLKVGQSGLYDDCLDFIFKMDEKSLPALTEEIKHYLGELQTV